MHHSTSVEYRYASRRCEFDGRLARGERVMRVVKRLLARYHEPQLDADPRQGENQAEPQWKLELRWRQAE